MGQTAYSLAMQQMGEIIEKANLNQQAVDAALGPINEQLADLTQRGINVMNFGAKGDGSTEDTGAFQSACLAAIGGTLYIPRQTGPYYLIGQVNIPSDITIVLQPGVVIQAVDTLPQTSPAGVIFDLRDVNKVTIEGNYATLQMNKSAYSGEFNHCVRINGCTNVEVRNLICKNSGGDGFYIGGINSILPYSENIRLIGCTADNNRRQGLSITSADGVYVTDCIFSNQVGTDPQSGVDIEPNGPADIIKNITFKSCKFLYNQREGIVINLSRLNSTSEPVSIVVEDCYAEGNAHAYNPKYIKDDTKGVIRFRGCVAKLARFCGFLSLGNSARGIEQIFEDCIAYDCNTTGGSQFSYSSFFLVEDTANNLVSEFGNVNFIRCFARNDNSTMARGYGVRNNQGTTPKNIRLTECDAVGYTITLYDTNESSVNCLVSKQLPDEVVMSAISLDVNMSTQRGKTLINTASGARTRSLTVANENDMISFRSDTNFSVNILPPSGYRIFPIASAAGIGIRSNQTGAFITLRGRADGNWYVDRMIGTWEEIP